MIKIGENYKHNDSGRIYTVTAIGKMKNLNGWVGCIVYIHCSNIYVREIEDFKEKFTLEV